MRCIQPDFAFQPNRPPQVTPYVPQSPLLRFAHTPIPTYPQLDIPTRSFFLPTPVEYFPRYTFVPLPEWLRTPPP